MKLWRSLEGKPQTTGDKNFRMKRLDGDCPVRGKNKTKNEKLKSLLHKSQSLLNKNNSRLDKIFLVLTKKNCTEKKHSAKMFITSLTCRVLLFRANQSIAQAARGFFVFWFGCTLLVGYYTRTTFRAAMIKWASKFQTLFICKENSKQECLYKKNQALSTKVSVVDVFLFFFNPNCL